MSLTIQINPANLYTLFSTTQNPTRASNNPDQGLIQSKPANRRNSSTSQLTLARYQAALRRSNFSRQIYLRSSHEETPIFEKPISEFCEHKTLNTSRSRLEKVFTALQINTVGDLITFIKTYKLIHFTDLPGALESLNLQDVLNVLNGKEEAQNLLGSILDPSVTSAGKMLFSPVRKVIKDLDLSSETTYSLDLPNVSKTRIWNALEKKGIFTIKQLQSITKEELEDHSSLGVASINELKKALQKKFPEFVMKEKLESESPTDDIHLLGLSNATLNKILRGRLNLAQPKITTIQELREVVNKEGGFLYELGINPNTSKKTVEEIEAALEKYEQNQNSQ